MNKFFQDSDYDNALDQFHRITLFYIAIAVVYAILMIVFIIAYVNLPYNDPNQVLIKWLVGLISTGFILFSFPYCGIKMQRSKAYCKLLKNISLGIKERGLAYFSHIDDWEVKDRVDVNVFVFKTWNNKKQVWDYRNVYIDAEKTAPEFLENEEVEYITEGNVLVEYRRTGKFYQIQTEEPIQ